MIKDSWFNVMIKILSLTDAFVFLVPLVLYYFNFISLLQALILIIVSLISFFLLCNCLIKFPELNRDDVVNILIAPDESSSKFANRFLKKIFDLNLKGKEKEYRNKDYRNFVIGTDTIECTGKIELILNVSDIAFNGVPNLQQMITIYYLRKNIVNYIYRNRSNIKNILFFCSADVGIDFFQMIKDKVGDDIRLITSGLPEKEIIMGEIGKQTEAICNLSNRLVVQYSGGLFTKQLNRIISEDKFKEKNIFRCQSSIVMEYLDQARKTLVNLNSNKHILLSIGSRNSEIYRHIGVAKFVLNIFRDTTYSIVFLCNNKDRIAYIKKLLPAQNNVFYELEEDFDYSLGKLAICKSGIGLLKPVNFGIPTIPFYTSDLRTKFLIKCIDFLPFFKKFPRQYFVLPNIITESKLLKDDFMFEMDWSHFQTTINEFLVSPPNTEEIRILLVSHLLELSGEFNSYDEAIDVYYKKSIKNLVQIAKRISSDIAEDFETCEIKNIQNLNDNYFSILKRWFANPLESAEELMLTLTQVGLRPPSEIGLFLSFLFNH